MTGKPIGEKYYKDNENWNTKFKNLSNPYEECRADSVALYLGFYRESFEIL